MIHHTDRDQQKDKKHAKNYRISPWHHAPRIPPNSLPLFTRVLPRLPRCPRRDRIATRASLDSSILTDLVFRGMAISLLILERFSSSDCVILLCFLIIHIALKPEKIMSRIAHI
jgi:hypothetical protein